MSDPKPGELTEAEKHSLRAWWEDNDAHMVELQYVVARIVEAREIAAEQAGREDNALHDMCYVSGSKALEAREAAARREAWATISRVQGLAGDLQRRGDTEGARLIFAALNGERA